LPDSILERWLSDGSIKLPNTRYLFNALPLLEIYEYKELRRGRKSLKIKTCR
jgi:hypothetical protein